MSETKHVIHWSLEKLPGSFVLDRLLGVFCFEKPGEWLLGCPMTSTKTQVNLWVNQMWRCLKI